MAEERRETVHPETMLFWTAEGIATLMHEARRHGAKQGGLAALRAGRAIRVVGGLVDLAKLAAQTKRGDAA